MKEKWNMFFTGWLIGACIHLVLLYPVCDTISRYATGVAIGCLIFGGILKVFTDEM